MINFIKGDATQPIGVGNKLIIHVCNNVGGWGKGFVLALSSRWKEPEKLYREYAKNGALHLGTVQYALCDGIDVSKNDNRIIVANMIAQEGYGKNNKNFHKSTELDAKPPIRYDALRECLDNVSEFINKQGVDYTVHMPRIGCGLAGGKWEIVQHIIRDTLLRADIEVYVYDL